MYVCGLTNLDKTYRLQYWKKSVQEVNNWQTTNNFAVKN